ncbi:hypothetical protein [Phenylobacterium montanum]|uniref:Uncharacterized protein n=1 Tax=Phenylobacterium montanum TaxID=2823693 RepID=A0A975FZC8_9CAUL|nr:hypothetical protein [Caulobacter sp. S6]QUD88060.1 hypothetical protein KCG34_24015 [Caulobacter sp. S6]
MGRRLIGWAAIAGGCLIAGAAAAQPLAWAPPVLIDPLTVVVRPGDFTASCQGRDCRLVWPPGRHVGAVRIFNARNLVSIGGWTSVPQPADHSNAPPSRILEVSGATGVVHIEGLLGDASAGGMSDGLDFNAPKAVVQIENVRIDGVFGFYDQFHADCIQPFGGVKALRVDRFTCRTGYQGLSIWPVSTSPAGWSVDLRHVDITAIGPVIHGAHNDGGYLYWPCRAADCANVARTSLSEVYLQPRPGMAAASTVWTGGLVQPMAGAIGFSRLPIDGHVTIGAPPNGDFVPPGVAGPAYRSPGYAPAAN